MSLYYKVVTSCFFDKVFTLAELPSLAKEGWMRPLRKPVGPRLALSHERNAETKGKSPFLFCSNVLVWK